MNACPPLGARSDLWREGDASTVGAVIVHYHRERDVGDLVGNLVEVQGLPISNIILVDNGSSAGVLESELRCVGHRPHVVSLPNVGYAAAMNVGWRAMPPGIRYVVMLSHEVVLEAGCLSELVSELRTRPRALVGPVLTIDGSTVWSAGGLLTRVRALPSHRLRGRSVDDVPDGVEPCTWLDGAVVATTRALLEELGGLDEDFFLYMEDVDLGMRARRAAAEVLVVPHARAQQTPSPVIEPYIWTRNMFLLLGKHERWLAWLLWLWSCSGRLLGDAVVRSSTDSLSRRLRGVRDGLCRRTGRPPI